MEPAMSGEPEPLVFDDDFVRGASFTEPAARERARHPGWLKRRRMARAARRRGRSATKTAGTVLVVVLALALVGGMAWKIRGSRTFSPETAPVNKGAVPALSAADPFAGSPAAAYADGAAGITPPPATSVGGFKSRDVVAAYARTERLLTATALDRPTLLGGSPDAFARAVGPDERSFFVNNLNNPDVDKRTRWWLVTFAPHTAELVGTIIKVHGHMAARPATHDGVHGVGVGFDYLFVYPVQRPGAPGTLERLVARVSGEAFYYLRSGVMHTATQDWSVAPTPARCDVSDGFVHPAYDDSPAQNKAAAGRPVDPYDQSRPAREDGKCHRMTGT
jgi:hypothetical protein